jgi:uncharacterized metal-binding protein YceD (DUF177 family)
MTPLDWIHAVRDVPSEGLAVARTVTGDEAARLAKDLDIVSVDALTVTYRLTPRSGGRLALSGSIAGRITQTCVVTLEPVAGALSLPLDVVFTPQAGSDDPAVDGSLDDLDGPDEEPIENGSVDIGRIVLEELLSGLDPYPRSAGAAFDWTDDKTRADANPFAALSRLKNPRQPE